MKKITLLFFSLLCTLITAAQEDTSGTQLDTSGNTYYYIQFDRASGGNQGVIQDMGVDVDLRTKKARKNTDSQLWSPSISSGQYIFTNKLGREIGYSGNTFKAVSVANGVAFNVYNSQNAGFPNSYELNRDGSARHMNQNGGGGFERTLGEWNAGDIGNTLKFIKESDAEDETIGVLGGLGEPQVAVLPELDTWYYIQFIAGNAVIQDKGDGSEVETAYPFENDDSQQWKITGTEGNYTITSKAGNTLNYDATAELYTATSAASTTTFGLVVNLPNFELQRTGETTSINQFNGAGFGKKIGEWNLGDVNSVLKFVLPENMTYSPKISSGTDEYYYNIQFLNGNNVMQDMGEGVETTVQAYDSEDDSQLWKITGSQTAMVFVSKDGNTLEYDAGLGRFVTTSSPTPTYFTIKATANTVNTTGWELIRDGESKGVNQFGGGVPGAQLGEWNYGDNNNRLAFRVEGDLLSTDNVSIKDDINLYPNPFINKFTFNFKNTSTNNVVVNLYSVTGKLVRSQSLGLKNNGVTVDGNGLAKGLYIVQVKTDEGKASFKLVKQ